MTNVYTGSCLCGVVKFEIDEFPPDAAAHCHCRMCRKFHGAAFATFVGVQCSKFRWLEGAEALQAYTAENDTTRTFCRHCGSSLTFASPSGSEDEIEIALGTIDDNVPVVPSAHIFVPFAANWTVFSDDLPRYGAARGSARVID